jgi:hypothetical protein
MPLKIDTNNEVATTEPKIVSTNKADIKGVFFNFDNSKALANIAFGKEVDGEFVAIVSEAWLLQGDYYIQSISSVAEGTSKAEVLLNAVATVIGTIQNTPNLKQELVDSGELKVVNGSIFSMLTAITA